MADIIKVLTETKPQEFFVNVIPGETSWQVAQRLNDPAQSPHRRSAPVPAEGTLARRVTTSSPATAASRSSRR